MVFFAIQIAKVMFVTSRNGSNLKSVLKGFFISTIFYFCRLFSEIFILSSGIVLTWVRNPNVLLQRRHSFYLSSSTGRLHDHGNLQRVLIGYALDIRNLTQWCDWRYVNSRQMIDFNWKVNMLNIERWWQAIWDEHREDEIWNWKP